MRSSDVTSKSKTLFFSQLFGLFGLLWNFTTTSYRIPQILMVCHFLAGIHRGMHSDTPTSSESEIVTSTLILIIIASIFLEILSFYRLVRLSKSPQPI